MTNTFAKDLQRGASRRDVEKPSVNNYDADLRTNIGVISLHRDEWDNRGYWLGLPWHRQGLMTEAVVAVNDYWFDVLGFTVLRAPKAVANVASRRISEKTGMRLIATVERDYVSGRLPAEIWEITAEEWRAKRTEFSLERSA